MVSVIVPVYNCERYLEKCLSSLAAQTYADCQFVIVDDGSSDGSRDISARFAQKDKRFKVICQRNSGVSAARNVGLAAAEGEYIAFADADDYASPEFIETLLSALETAKADVAVCDYDLVFENLVEKNALGLKDEVILGDGACGRYWLDFVARSPVLWNKLFTRDVIDRSGADFIMKSGEDYMFNTAVAPFVTCAASVSKSLYSYVQRPSSLMRSADQSKESYTFLDAFLDRQAGQDVYIKLGDDCYNLLCAMAFTALIHSAEAIGRDSRFYRGQLYNLSAWDGYNAFCRSMARGEAMGRLCVNGSVGRKFAALMRLVFLPASLGAPKLTAAMLPIVQRSVQRRKRGNSENMS